MTSDITQVNEKQMTPRDEAESGRQEMFTKIVRLEPGSCVDFQTTNACISYLLKNLLL